MRPGRQGPSPVPGPPTLWKSLLSVAVVALIGSLKIFAEVYVMTQGGPAGGTEVLNYLMYTSAFEYLQLGYSATMAIVLLLITLLLSMLTMRVLERRV